MLYRTLRKEHQNAYLLLLATLRMQRHKCCTDKEHQNPYLLLFPNGLEQHKYSPELYGLYQGTSKCLLHLEKRDRPACSSISVSQISTGYHDKEHQNAYCRCLIDRLSAQATYALRQGTSKCCISVIQNSTQGTSKCLLSLPTRA